MYAMYRSHTTYYKILSFVIITLQKYHLLIIYLNDH